MGVSLVELPGKQDNQLDVQRVLLWLGEQRCAEALGIGREGSIFAPELVDEHVVTPIPSAGEEIIQSPKGIVPRFRVEKFNHGQSNPTFLIELLGNGVQFVLRRKPVGKLLPSAHNIEREFIVMSALQSTPVGHAALTHF